MGSALVRGEDQWHDPDTCHRSDRRRRRVRRRRDRQRAQGVIAAASATAGRARAPLLFAHVVRSTWESRVPAFRLDAVTPRVVAYGAPGPRLLAVAEGRGAGLIVVGSRVLGRLRGRFSSRVFRYVARRARCPVMIVPASADPDSPRTGTHAVCVLESDKDERVLREAMALARRLTARL